MYTALLNWKKEYSIEKIPGSFPGPGQLKKLY